MKDIIKRDVFEIAKFDPKKTKLVNAKIDAIIALAKEMQDWPLLEQAVEKKVHEQHEFVTWWKANVREARRPSSKVMQNGITKVIDRLSMTEAEKDTGIRQEQVSRWKSRLKDPDKYQDTLFKAAYRAAFGNASQLNQQSISNEHYTPALYVDAARSVLGEIDLDPASCLKANEVIKAKRIFTIGDNGLEKKWGGRVWLNPPYGGAAGQFIEKLAADYRAKRVTAAIALVNAHCTDTAWFQLLWDGCLCFTNHRINFYGDDTRSGSTHGSVFVYFGEDRVLFAEAFTQFGAVVKRFYDN